MALALAGEVDDALVDRGLGAIDVLDEIDQATRIVEGALLHLLRLGRFGRLFLSGFGRLRGIADHLVDDLIGGDSLVGKRDGQSLVQKGHLLQPARDRLEVVLRGLEDVGVGPEPHRRPRLLGGFALLEGARNGGIVGLEPLVSVAGDVDLQAPGQGVDHRDAHAVQTTGNLICAGFEFSAGVQHGHHHVDGGHAGGVHRDRDAAAVVGDFDSAVFQHSHIHPAGIAGHRLVDGVVHDLPHEVVQTALAGGTNTHARALTNCLQTLQNGDRRDAVFFGLVLLLGSHDRWVSLKGRG